MADVSPARCGRSRAGLHAHADVAIDLRRHHVDLLAGHPRRTRVALVGATEEHARTRASRLARGLERGSLDGFPRTLRRWIERERCTAIGRRRTAARSLCALLRALAGPVMRAARVAGSGVAASLESLAARFTTEDARAGRARATVRARRVARRAAVGATLVQGIDADVSLGLTARTAIASGWLVRRADVGNGVDAEELRTSAEHQDGEDECRSSHVAKSYHDVGSDRPSRGYRGAQMPSSRAPDFARR